MDDQSQEVPAMNATDPELPQLDDNEPKATGGSSSGRRPRKDKNCVHAMHHGILAAQPFQALIRLGENAKRLRRIERTFRTELKPTGAVAGLLFDRFWSSYLRCLMAARFESSILIPIKSPEREEQTPTLRQGENPVLIWQEGDLTSELTLSQSVFRELVLVERYDRHFSRELYRSLCALLLLRDGGHINEGFSVARMLGTKDKPEE
jgi:hypothetical protein